MKKKDIARYQKTLIAWYLENCRTLPWRKTHDPYSIWVSEVMLQQTQVNTVVPYYREFLKKFPTVKRLARANLIMPGPAIFTVPPQSFIKNITAGYPMIAKRLENFRGWGTILQRQC
jgi:hypothetical protein